MMLMSFWYVTHRRKLSFIYVFTFFATNYILHYKARGVSIDGAGPACSETAEPIAGLSQHFNTIAISYSADAIQLSSRSAFPLFFRTIPTIMQNG